MKEAFKKTFTKKEREMGKRGQTSIFIIVGVAVLVIIGLILLFTQTDVSIGRRVSSTQLEPIKEYIEECVEDKLVDDMALLRGNRGYFGRPPTYRSLADLGSGKLPEIGNIENDLNVRIEDTLLFDCDLTEFEGDYLIEAKKTEIQVSTNIGDKFVNVKVKYPIVIQRGDAKVGIDEISVNHKEEFGRIRRIANAVIEDHVDKLSFEDRLLVEKPIGTADPTKEHVVIKTKPPFDFVY
jgi:hypothetical protein